MDATSYRWGFCGGWGIDLFLGRETRSHQDIDVAVFREGQQIIREHLVAGGWTFRKVVDGIAEACQADEFVKLPCHEIWCRNAAFDPAEFELLLNESHEADFIFRRDPSIRLPLDRAILKSKSDLPVLAPEIVLLYKSRDFGSARNAADFDGTAGQLDAAARRWLRNALSRSTPEHPWIRSLGDQ